MNPDPEQCAKCGKKAEVYIGFKLGSDPEPPKMICGRCFDTVMKSAGKTVKRIRREAVKRS